MKYLQQVVEGRDLTVSEAEALLGEVFNGATDAQIGALLVALKMKGEAVSEIAGLARAMRAQGVRISPRVPGPLVDTCGTGGDGSNTINVSTCAAIVAASSGAFVAKHGNSAATSASGSPTVRACMGGDVAPADRRRGAWRRDNSPCFGGWETTGWNRTDQGVPQPAGTPHEHGTRPDQNHSPLPRRAAASGGKHRLRQRG